MSQITYCPDSPLYFLLLFYRFADHVVLLFLFRHHFTLITTSSPIRSRHRCSQEGIRPYKIIRQDALHLLYAGFDDGVVTRGTILPQKKLQDLNRNVRAFLNLLGQVFTDDLSVEILTEFILHVFPAGHVFFHVLSSRVHRPGQSDI